MAALDLAAGLDRRPIAAARLAGGVLNLVDEQTGLALDAGLVDEQTGLALDAGLVDEQTGLALDAGLDRCDALDAGLVDEQTGLALDAGLDRCVAGVHEQVVVEQFAVVALDLGDEQAWVTKLMLMWRLVPRSWLELGD